MEPRSTERTILDLKAAKDNPIQLCPIEQRRCTKSKLNISKEIRHNFIGMFSLVRVKVVTPLKWRHSSTTSSLTQGEYISQRKFTQLQTLCIISPHSQEQITRKDNKLHLILEERSHFPSELYQDLTTAMPPSPFTTPMTKATVGFPVFFINRYLLKDWYMRGPTLSIMNAIMDALRM